MSHGRFTMKKVLQYYHFNNNSHFGDNIYKALCGQYVEWTRNTQILEPENI